MDEEAVHRRQQAARWRTGAGHPARGRQAARDGWTVQRNQRGPWRLLHDRGRRLRRSGGARARTSASRVRRHDRGQTSLRIVTTSPETGVLLEHLFRHQAGRMVARLTRLLGPEYVVLAEETVQEAMLRALQTWPYQGVPENAAGWRCRVTRAWRSASKPSAASASAKSHAPFSPTKRRSRSGWFARSVRSAINI